MQAFEIIAVISRPWRGQMSVETNDNNNMRPRRGRTLSQIIAATDMRGLSQKVNLKFKKLIINRVMLKTFY